MTTKTRPTPQSAGSAGSAGSADGPAIELRGITKRFGDQVAVDHLDLIVPRGQMLALLGPNGAGKSTTTEVILGLTRPDEGSVTVCGTSPALAAQRGQVGAMLQSGSLLDDVPVRVMLDLVAGVCAHPLPVDEVIERADIASLLRKNTSKLSGGEAQRVRFALALLPDPDVILLDEPTVAMDVETRHRFWERMRHVAAGGRTVIFATHYLEEADQEAARIVVLVKGRVVADGTGAEIKARIGGQVVTCLVTPDATGLDPTAGLDRLPGVTAVTALDDGRTRLTTDDSDATLAALFAPDGLATRRLVTGIGASTPTLEDAFLHLTHDQEN